MVGTWQASSDDMHRGWERNVAAQDGVYEQHVDGPPSLKDVVAGYLPCGNVGAPMNPSFMQMLSMSQEKQGVPDGKEGLLKAERFHVMPPGRTGSPGDVAEKMVVKREATGDESLEACVMSCRKREREDSLGEVVQRVCVGGQKVEAGEWLSDWNEFGDNATAGSVLEEKVPVVPPSQLEDLDDIFSGSPPPPPSVEFWLGENLPSVHQQVHNHGFNEVSRANIVSHGNHPSSGKVQLDLFEAVQAELLYRGGGNGGSGGGFASSVTSSPRPANISPSIQVLPRSMSLPFTSSLNQPFSPGGSPLAPPLQRHSFGDSAPPAATFMPEFLDSKPPPPASTMLNATFAPAPPHFSSPLQQLQELAFPLPASFKKVAPPQVNFFGFPRPEYHPPKLAEFTDPKPWQMRVLEGDVPPKVIPGGPKWQLKPEPGWQPVERFGAGHARGPHLNPHSPMPAEHAPRRQAFVPEHVGRRVRLEELSLAERVLCAASEAAQLGDLSSAQAILARLNQQSSPKGQQQQQQLPARRVILLFAEALSKWVAAASSSPTPCPFQQPLPSNSPLDLINKIGAYKKFCEVSPISQFAHFTANQAILEAMEGEDCVHLIDLELGFGGQWASFMQEISQRGRGPPELKITTMGADTLQMRLAKENLLQFAKEVGMKLEVNVVPVQKLEGMKAAMVNKGEKEAVAVNFGFGMNRLLSEFSASTEEVLGFLQTVKGLCPKVVTVVDSECEFEGPSGYIEALQFYSCVFESLEASTKLSAEVVHNIERLVFGPKIADLVNARRLHKSSSESGLLPWRILLQKVGFNAFPFSSAAESQASWLVKNPLNMGFTFLKQHATLLLGWYNKTLISASAWV
ncbi:hypothetical protein GOP47_0008889 [Adiantum capillus-veneris]|uniref:Uncharacterized protein n=1 Tax=Adiantum capillus-veneris TaxID=13818 RepID=A0A9D4ZIK7_ADICA|nr:hypothetical protein GOP47_0008889 [Adiantum capillus-veneris]